MDLTDATEVEKQQIIEAREELIFNQSWVADGFYAESISPDGTVDEVLPQFHEIFPEDWDIPMMGTPHEPCLAAADLTDMESTARNSTWWQTIHEEGRTLYTPSESINTEPFYHFSTLAYVEHVKFSKSEVYTWGGMRFNPVTDILLILGIQITTLANH